MADEGLLPACGDNWQRGEEIISINVTKNL